MYSISHLFVNCLLNYLSDYSYPEFQGVKVDQKATDAERVAARTRISKYYGFDPQAAVTKVDSEAWAHLPVTPATEAGLPENYKAIRGFRVFIVLVRLPEHAFNRTYSLELYYNGGNQSRLVGTVTVFARTDHSPCKACAKRREKGSIVRGVIPLPPSLVNEIIVNSGIDRTKATLETTTTDITKTLYGKLLDMSGKLLATADGGATTPVPDKKAASPKVTPVETTLYTSAVAERTADDGRPVHLYDWQPHNDLFPVSWTCSDDADMLANWLIEWMEGRFPRGFLKIAFHDCANCKSDLIELTTYMCSLRY